MVNAYERDGIYIQIDVLHVIVLHKLIHYELFYGTDIRRSNKEGC